MKKSQVNKVTKPSRRVVVTGLGVVSSLGIGWPDFWKNLLAGKSGISTIESFDTQAYDRHMGGEVKDFKPQDFIDRRKVKFMGRASQFAIAASKLALADAGLKLGELPADRMGVCVGTTMGEPQILEVINKITFKEGLSEVGPGLVLQYPSSVIPFNTANELKITNRSYLFANACASGNYSIGYSFDCIKNNYSDIMLAGGSDQFSRLNFTGFSRLMAIAPEKCQPFDKNRQGIMVGEGCGMLVIEDFEHARQRKAQIYAEILGYGLSCDAVHMTMPDENGIYKCMKKSCENSGIKPGDIDYISAHGTGTHQNDITETKAIKHLYGHKTSKIPPVSSIKSMLGHTMGAASALEAISCCLAIKDQIAPPTINYETSDPECDLDYIPNEARKMQIDVILNNSCAFGGNNAGVVLRKS